MRLIIATTQQLEESPTSVKTESNNGKRHGTQMSDNNDKFMHHHKFNSVTQLPVVSTLMVSQKTGQSMENYSMEVFTNVPVCSVIIM